MYAQDLTSDYAGFVNLWRYMAAHLVTYGHPPDYKKTANFLAMGGFMAMARLREIP